MYNIFKLLPGLIILISCNVNKIEKNEVDRLPNILYILVDDLGYGDISAFNQNGKIITPNFDKLAKEGMLFTDAHTSSSVCTPTRYGILTGRYNWRTTLKKGVLDGESKALIPNERTTIASLLKSKSYSTAFIGKWHLGWNWELKEKPDSLGNKIDFTKPITNSPNDVGFDYAYGHNGSLDMAPYVYVENKKITKIPTKILPEAKGQAFMREGYISEDFIPEEVTPNFIKRSINYIADKANEKSPFFLYLALPSPHTPILPKEEFIGKSGLDNPYADFVIMVDNYIGQVLDQIKKSGIESNTLVVFTSDNGCSPKADFNQLKTKSHNPSGIYRGHKADIYEGGHRVPFIVKWPKKIKAGSICNKTICTTDFMATAATITNYKLKDNEAEDSFNMIPLLTQSNKEIFYRKSTIHHSIEGSFAIRKGDYKLIMDSGSGGWSYPTNIDKKELKMLPEIQLYNLAKDPQEQTNLQADFPEIVEDLKKDLNEAILNGRTTAGVKQQNDTGLYWKQLWWLNK